jgi:hypothetical protein
LIRPAQRDVGGVGNWLRFRRRYLMAGRVRQALLNEAIAAGNARRVELFFRQFQQQEGQSSTSSSSRASGRGRSVPVRLNGIGSRPTFSRPSTKAACKSSRISQSYVGHFGQVALPPRCFPVIASIVPLS